MSLLGLIFGGDKKTVNTSTNTSMSTTNNTTTDSYNTQLTNNLTRSDSFIQANSTVQNTALDFINTYNLADTGNIYGGGAGDFAKVAASLDLNSFFESTRPAAPASASLGSWNEGNTIKDKFAGLTNLQDKVNAGAAGLVNATKNNALYWIAGAAILALVLLVWLKRRK